MNKYNSNYNSNHNENNKESGVDIIYISNENYKKTIEKITSEVDRKLIKNFSKSFNELVDKALDSYKKDMINTEFIEIFKMNKEKLNNILETAQILRDETSEEKIKQEYKKHQAKYILDSIIEYSMFN